VRLLMVSLAVFVGLFAARPARGSEELERAILDLTVNGSPRGEVFVFVGKGDVIVPLARLRAAGLARLQAPTVQLAGVAHVSLKAASPPLSFTYDEAALTVDIVAPSSALVRSTLDFSSTAPPDLVYDYTPSIFINYAPRLVDGRDFQAFAEAGLSLGATVVDTSATYRPRDGATRLISKAVFDDRSNLRTATLGDTYVSAGPLGGALLLGGVSLSRNYALDPYLVKIPRLAFAASALAPSTLDVYVNDVLVRRVPVDAGEFQLTNISPITGAGTTRYVLRDAFGREQRLESTYYASAGVLARGLSEYTYGVGLARRAFGIESFSYGEPAMVARHRFGITDNLTSGFHAELDRSRTNAGSELTIGAALGEIELHLAASSTIERSPRRGTAGILAYAYRRANVALRTTLRGASHDYSSLSLDPAHDRSLVEHVTSVGHTLGSRSNLAADVAFAWLRDAGPGARLSLTLSTRLSRGLGLQIRTSRSRAGLAAWQHDVFSVLTVSLPLHHSAELTEHIGSSGSSVTARLSRPLREPTDVGYQVSGAVGSEPRAAATVQGQASFGRLDATYTTQAGQQHTLVEASGSLVLVGKSVYFTQPLNQSFAVLHVPGAPGVRGYFNNREMGKTDGNGRLFIPNLFPYQSNRLSIAAEDLPVDYELEADEVTLAPPTRGGAVVTFPTRRIRFARGWIERRVGRHFAMVKDGTLSVVTSNGTFVSLIGHGGEFEFDGLPEGEWEGSVRSTGGSCRVTVVVGPSDEPVQSLGAVICNVAHPKAAHP
jgi:outer membrane usher protein